MNVLPLSAEEKVTSIVSMPAGRASDGPKDAKEKGEATASGRNGKRRR